MTTLIPKFDLMNGGTTPTGAVNRDINQKLQEIVSVKDFGAVGNGTTDDTVAIQAAINSVAISGAVYMPAGVYKITATILINKRIKLYGDGAIEQTGTGYTAATQILKEVNDVGIKVTQGSVTIEDIYLKGGTLNGNAGIYVLGSRFSATRVTVTNMADAGFTIGAVAQATPNTNVNLWRLDRCVSNSNNYGFIFNDQETVVDCNAGTATLISASNNTLDGIRVNFAVKNTFVGTHAETNGRYGVYLLANAQNNTFIGGDLEGNTTNDLYIDSTTGYNVIQNVGILGSYVDTDATTIHIGLASEVQIPTVGATNFVSQIKYSTGKPGMPYSRFAPISPATNSATAIGFTNLFTIQNSKTMTVTTDSAMMFFLVQFEASGKGAIAYATYDSATINFVGTPDAVFAATASPTALQIGISKSANSYVISFTSGSNLTPQARMGISFLGCSVSTVTAWA